jgi:pimeloyl-ACP methyl ester carboxylesterase
MEAEGVTTTPPPPAPSRARAAGPDNGRATGEDVRFSAPDGPRLSGYLARPSFSAASGSGRHGVVLAHGFPEPGQQDGVPSSGYPQLATRLAAETGASVLSFDFRGTGASHGDFSGSGWRADLAAAVGQLRSEPGIERIWLVGFAAGGTVCLCMAGEDTSIAGVATLAAPAVLVDHGAAPRRVVSQARALGIIHSRGYPEDPVAWARELEELDALANVARVPPRPVLVLHGAVDEVVPVTDARELADAADASAELRVVAAAGHMLLHDPRAVALLLGWFDRHLGAGA